MKKDAIADSLKRNTLFSSLTLQELSEIQKSMVIKRVKKNEVILHEENANDFMYIILEGDVKVIQTTERGKEILVTMHHQHDSFGELSLIDRKTAPATVFAVRNSIIAILSRRDFYSLLHTYSKMLDNLLRLLCTRLRDSLKRIQMLNFNNASQRIKMLFLMLSENYGEDTVRGTLLKIKLIHQDIADMTGLTRETVTRVLDKWQKSGEIQIQKNKFILLKPEFESIPF
ncbi:MAG: Crp/Fnr family transcriptional regulator [Nitrospirota bacterium]